MSSLQDTLYNWLTIKVVADVRVDDTAAQDTVNLFYEVLTEEHGISEITVKKDEQMYEVSYVLQGEQKRTRFPVELIDVMLEQMEAEPEKFINYPKEEENDEPTN
ncbi:hypothetical protein [Bacillus suaedaesalsae]|uniref:Uncharacterized protein n=1 Tax=Bacillus suaedaesalsae TaxID=2810349 RepID=A0ABS2DJD5_9BACI|nr:hypothetical protein [Bacillus suaedaesalsae]MBM6618605.1 hypothetical protein [Bacillus suaedaesalsae]